MSRGATQKRDEVRQKVLQSRMLGIFRDDPGKNFSVDEVKTAMDTDDGFSSIDTETVLKFIQYFIRNGHVRLVPIQEKNRYRFVPDDISERFSGLHGDHHRLYALIEEYGDQGIWRLDVKKKMIMDERQLTVMINELKKRQLIKEIVAVSEKKKKLLLWDTEPSAEVTGGIWFTGAQFNTSLIDDNLLPTVAKFVANEPGMGMAQLADKIVNNGVGNVGYSHEEARQIVTAAIAAGRVINIGGALRPPPLNPVVCPISRTPCHGCPFSAVCEPGGAKNPSECAYLQKMIEEL